MTVFTLSALQWDPFTYLQMVYIQSEPKTLPIERIVAIKQGSIVKLLSIVLTGKTGY